MGSSTILSSLTCLLTCADPPRQESTFSCETSWMTEFSRGLFLKRFFLMVLQVVGSLQSWSDEQMMWMGELSTWICEPSGQLVNQGSFHPGLPDKFRGSSCSTMGQSGGRCSLVDRCPPSCLFTEGRMCSSEGKLPFCLFGFRGSVVALVPAQQPMCTNQFDLIVNLDLI